MIGAVGELDRRADDSGAVAGFRHHAAQRHRAAQEQAGAGAVVRAAVIERTARAPARGVRNRGAAGDAVDRGDDAQGRVGPRGHGANRPHTRCGGERPLAGREAAVRQPGGDGFIDTDPCGRARPLVGDHDGVRRLLAGRRDRGRRDAFRHRQVRALDHRGIGSRVVRHVLIVADDGDRGRVGDVGRGCRQHVDRHRDVRQVSGRDHAGRIGMRAGHLLAGRAARPARAHSRNVGQAVRQSIAYRHRAVDRPAAHVGHAQGVGGLAADDEGRAVALLDARVLVLLGHDSQRVLNRHAREIGPQIQPLPVPEAVAAAVAPFALRGGRIEPSRGVRKGRGWRRAAASGRQRVDGHAGGSGVGPIVVESRAARAVGARPADGVEQGQRRPAVHAVLRV